MPAINPQNFQLRRYLKYDAVAVGAAFICRAVEIATSIHNEAAH